MEDVEQYREAMFAVVYALNRNSHDAEDAVQEAYIKLITKPPRHRKNIKAWLCTVARNACIDKLRKRNVIKTIDADHMSSLEDKNFTETVLGSEYKDAPTGTYLTKGHEA